jgi:hypothetical protein
MFGEIVRYLRGGEKSGTVATFRDGAQVLRVIDATEKSSEMGCWVEVGEGSG